ncbi:MAG: FAD-binding oxidoreductase [Caulobacterales bacterium]
MTAWHAPPPLAPNTLDDGVPSSEYAEVMTPQAELIERLKTLLGPKGYLHEAMDVEPFARDWRGRVGATPFVAMPSTTEEVAAVVKAAHEAGVPLVPQGGNSGMVRGSLPQNEIVLSLRRMNKIREISPQNDSIIAEAGVILTQVQDAAKEAGRLFPLSLGAEGVATIGGLVSTNAGGVAVLRYGMMRDLVFGLEVVLADGRIWNGLRTLRKDNTGYDLKQLFIGAEGTLGIVTAAALKLFPLPAAKMTAMCALTSLDAVVPFLPIAKSMSGGAVTGYELMGHQGVEFVLEHVPDTRFPFTPAPEWSLLLEMSFGREDGARDTIEAVLAAGMEEGLISDAVIAQSDAQSLMFWKVRDSHSEGEKKDGRGVHHDISSPVAAVPDLIRGAMAAGGQLVPSARFVAFGHAGDGNIHFTVKPPKGLAGGMTEDEVVAIHDEVQHAVHDSTMRLGGSISAEHGIGMMKRDELAERRSPLEMELLRTIKRTLDPAGTLNPGRVVK